MRRSAAAATVSSLAALSGCTDALPGADGGDGGVGGNDGPAFATAMYDPSTLVDAGNRVFFSTDAAALLELRDRMPDQFEERFATVNDASRGVDLTALDRVSGVAAAHVPADASEVVDAVGSLRATGSFEPDVLLEELRATTEGPARAEPAGSHGGVDLYRRAGTGSEETSAVLGLSGDAVYVGGTARADVEPTAPVTTMVDAAAGEADPYYGASEPATRVMDAFADAVSVTGVEVDPEVLEAGLAEGGRMARSMLSGLRATGSGTEVDGDTATFRTLLVYADGEAPERERVRSFVDLAKAQSGVGDELGEVAVERTDSSVTVSLSQPLSRLLERPETAGLLLGPSYAIVGSFVLSVGSTPEPRVQAGATVQFDEGADEIRAAYISSQDEDTSVLVTVDADTPEGSQNDGATLEAVGETATFSYPDGTVATVTGTAMNGGQRTVVFEKTGEL